MNEERPNPDQLLKQVQHEDRAKQRGHLKIYLGMAAGVGKTFSMLSDALLIPLIRYNVKDVARIYSYNEIQTILHDCGYGNLCPELKLPMLSVGGRKNRTLSIGKDAITPEAVKQGIYTDFAVAGATTGYFRLGIKDNAFVIEVQLKKGIVNSPERETAFRNAIATCVSAPFQLQIYAYQTFPYSMELDYERKFKNI